MALKDGTVGEIQAQIAEHLPRVEKLLEGARDMNSLNISQEAKSWVAGRGNFYDQRTKLCSGVVLAAAALVEACAALEAHGFPTIERGVAPASVAKEIRANQDTINAFAGELEAAPEAAGVKVEVGNPQP